MPKVFKVKAHRARKAVKAEEMEDILGYAEVDMLAQLAAVAWF